MNMKKILIIEDEQTLIKALVQSLGESGYKIETAEDGEEGIKKIKSFKPDLVLLDLILPKMDGFSVLAEMKKDPKLSDIKVIVLTNLSDVADKVLKMGASDCLIKSDFSVDQIKKAIYSKLD